MEPFARLREILGEVADLNAAQAVLGWDQETYMPSAGVAARAQQLGTLGRLAHEAFVAPEVGYLLDEVESEIADADPDSDDASIVRVVRRDYERLTRVPAELVAELARTTAVAQQAWREAREQSDFARFQPHLESVLELTLRKAEALGYEDSPYDALLDEYEPDMTSRQVAATFAAVREQLVPLVQAIGERPQIDDAVLHRAYDPAGQWAFGESVIRDFGFDFERGRQDRSTHPFSTSFSVNDTRITTRVIEGFLPTALFGTLHEAGHAMYEQGIDPALERTLLASGTSLGVHESQSRMWENLVGRSRELWSHYFPRLQRSFPEQLAGVGAEEFYRAINRVEPSLIRVEADEVTYSLHVMLRFEIEVAMVSGEIDVRDVPGAWNDLSEEYLGLRPGSDADGALQDIHWSLGAIGYFPTYALGNLISAQLYDQALLDVPDLRDQIGRGEFAGLLGWLRDRIHRHGRKFTASELLMRVTGRDLEADAWLGYVRAKFGEIYGL